MASIETILSNHGAKMIAHPDATFGITFGNPIWEEVCEIGKLFDNLFLVNVTLNKKKEITGVFSGDLLPAHLAGCAQAREMEMVPVEKPYDIVVTTNSGYPLDMNLYQSVKGMSAAARIVKKDGQIIIAAECRDGIPEHGCYKTLLSDASSPNDLLDKILNTDEVTPDQWQAQIQAQIQLNADISVYSDHLSEDQVTSALLEKCEDIEGTINTLVERMGKDTRICILPEGPQTIPYVR